MMVRYVTHYLARGSHEGVKRKLFKQIEAGLSAVEVS